MGYLTQKCSNRSSAPIDLLKPFSTCFTRNRNNTFFFAPLCNLESMSLWSNKRGQENIFFLFFFLPLHPSSPIHTPNIMPPSAGLPRVVLGTMTFGVQTTHDLSVIRVNGAENVEPFLELFHSYGHTELDTARVYGSGSTEKVLSQLPTAHLNISTKAWPFEDGSFNKENLAAQLRQSLKTLNATKVDIFYLHAPESATPMDVTAKAINDLYKEGLFERFGLSNFFSWQVASIYEICKQNGYVLPSVCQAMYNPISRSVATELLPCLKQFNISFYAYHPVAGGLLTGKYKFEQDVTEEGLRFDPKVRGKVCRIDLYTYSCPWKQLTATFDYYVDWIGKTLPGSFLESIDL